MMMVGTARRAVRNLALVAAVAVAFGAWAATEKVGGYMWTYEPEKVAENSACIAGRFLVLYSALCGLSLESPSKGQTDFPRGDGCDFRT